MINSLYISATGMHAQQQNVDSIANNLANVNTMGFKRNQITFSDAIYRASSGQSAPELGGVAPTFGIGTIVSSNGKSFTQGEIKQSSGALDLAIKGAGFLEVTLPDGSSAYTRYGALQVNEDGLLANSEGYPLKQQIQIPAGASEIVIDKNGKVSAKMQNETQLTDLGKIELTNFPNLDGLEPIGDNLLSASERAGTPSVGNPGEDGLGTLTQGYLEASNVQLADEMVNLVLAQRAYELNAKVIQASDEMLSISNNLRR